MTDFDPASSATPFKKRGWRKHRNPNAPVLPKVTGEDFRQAVRDLEELMILDITGLDWDLAPQFIKTCYDQVQEKGFLSKNQIYKIFELYEKLDNE